MNNCRRAITPEQMPELIRRYVELKDSATFLAAVYGVSPSIIIETLKRAGVVIRNRREARQLQRHVNKPRDLPTPEEIEERAAQIRAGWSPQERARRAGGRIRYTIPVTGRIGVYSHTSRAV